jgi:hypothetical protein
MLFFPPTLSENLPPFLLIGIDTFGGKSLDEHRRTSHEVLPCTSVDFETSSLILKIFHPPIYCSIRPIFNIKALDPATLIVSLDTEGRGYILSIAKLILNPLALNQLTQHVSSDCQVSPSSTLHPSFRWLDHSMVRVPFVLIYLFVCCPTNPSSPQDLCNNFSPFIPRSITLCYLFNRSSI